MTALTRTQATLVVLALAVPMLVPGLQPLVDLPDHVGRYAVAAADPASPLHQFYAYRWALVGNLGVDLIVAALGFLPVELATKLVVIAIPMLTAAGLLWLAHEIHGRSPATALFALPFVYTQPLLFGFVNFALGMALAIGALALWLRLSRATKRVRLGVFIVVAPLLWITHVFAWGVAGLLIAGAEFVRQRPQVALVPAVTRTGVALLAFAPSLLLMLAAAAGGYGETRGWFLWETKPTWLITVFRDRWMTLDLLQLLPPVAVLLAALAARRGMDARLGLGVALLGVAFVLLPIKLMGSAFADQRLAPTLWMLALVALRPFGSARWLMLAGCSTLAARLAVVTTSFVIAAHDRDAALVTTVSLPRGARVATLVVEPCGDSWPLPRARHLGGYLIVRHEAFTNSQWQAAGAQLLRVRERNTGAFTADPSQVVTATRCPDGQGVALADALARLPRAAFDHVWVVGGGAAVMPGARLVAGNAAAALWRVEP